jgi:hypothetical protein
MNHLGINYLGTLLSSQRTDAHPLSTLSRGRPAGGSVPIYQSSWPAFSAFRRSPRSLTLPELLSCLHRPFTGRFRRSETLPGFPTRFVRDISRSRPAVPVRRDRGGAEAPGGRTGGSSSAGPAIEVTLGVRSSLPGDEEIPYARRQTTVKPAPRALPAPRATWAFAPRRPG